MKEYTPPRLLPCNPPHHDHDCDPETCKDPTPCPGFCPKLVIKSAAPAGHPHLGPFAPDGSAILHAVTFTESEVRTLLREADKGYFDLDHMPPRKDSRFYDPLTAMLVQSLQDEPLRALGILLFLGNPQAVAFTAEPPTLAVRDSEGSWLYLHLDAETLDEWQAPEPPTEAEANERYQEALARGLSDAEAREEGWPTVAPAIEFPDPVSHHDVPPEGATILWERPQRAQRALTASPEAAADAEQAFTDPTRLVRGRPNHDEEDTRYDITDDGTAALDA